MDFATILGILGGFGVLFGAILIEGSSPASFMNMLATLVVFGGAITAVLIRYSIGSFISAIVLGFKTAIFNKHVPATTLIEEIIKLAEISRKEGPLGLEKAEVHEPFLKKGIQMLADGYTVEAIRRALERERDLQHERLTEGHKIFKALGDAAPGMGMVGTIIGLVSLFSHMDDPSKIGPGMAIALLTTLYGAVVANVIALPLSDKLQNVADLGSTNETLVIDAVIMMRENRSPAQIYDELMSYLPLHKRPDREERQAEAA